LFQFFPCLLFLRFINHGSHHACNLSLIISNNMTKTANIFYRAVCRYVPVVCFPNVTFILLNGSYLFFFISGRSSG
jgi:hypothetical protein